MSCYGIFFCMGPAQASFLYFLYNQVFSILSFDEESCEEGVTMNEHDVGLASIQVRNVREDTLDEIDCDLVEDIDMEACDSQYKSPRLNMSEGAFDDFETEEEAIEIADVQQTAVQDSLGKTVEKIIAS